MAAFLAAAAYGKAGAWNIGTGTEVSVLELASIISQVNGERAEYELAPPRMGELQRSALVSEQAGRSLGWRPAKPLSEGVVAVMKWFVDGSPDRTSL